MFETRTEEKTTVVFDDADFANARELFRQATNYLLRELRMGGDVTKATLAVNAASRVVETICQYGTVPPGDVVRGQTEGGQR